jgi:Glycosyltransferase
LEAYPVDAPIEPISNGVDHDALRGFEQLREEYRRRFGFDGTVVFTVGNVFERKGVSEFCELAKKFKNHDDTGADQFEFAWFGPYETGPFASSTVRDRVTDPPANVTFTDWIDDVRGAFAAGDIYLFPTHEENQGIAALEAMACGKPVILRDLPVFHEFYTDGQDCLMCKTTEEFEHAIQRLSRDPGLADRLGRHARETARSHSLEQVSQRLTDIYHGVVET